MKKRQVEKQATMVLNALVSLQSPAQCLTYRGHLTHICEWMTKWMNYPLIYFQVSLESLLHIRRCSMLNEQWAGVKFPTTTKNIFSIFKDHGTDVRWNYGHPQEGTRAGREPFDCCPKTLGLSSVLIKINNYFF